MFKSVRRRVATGMSDAVHDIRAAAAKVNRAPVIVLGNQKSGTSAIAALLAEMTGMSATLDFLREIRKPTIHRLRDGEVPMSSFVNNNKLEFSRQLIKEPSLSVFYEQLRAHFPGAKFIMVVRDPRDNIRSILNRHQFPGDLSDLTRDQWDQLSEAWRLVYDGSWLGLKGDTYIEMAAARWNYIADIYLANRDDIYLARYETFLANKVEAIRSIARAFNLEEKHDIAHRVDVPFQPRGQRDVNLAEFFGDNLQRIEDICAGRMEAFDYQRVP